ncbi:MAG: small basic family protein [Candidatus Sericytochromatia bacterium]|nr:small basic family protein [Candidatus Sericytochromatia bacterium]
MTSSVILPLVGLVIGIAVGAVAPFSVPHSLAKYTAVAILAALDTGLGGIRAGLENRFDLAAFISGFTFNTLLAAALTYLGDMLGIDLYIAAVVVFGVRLFDNLAVVRRLVVNRFWSQ